MQFRILQLITGSRLRNKFTLFFVILATVPVLTLGGMTLYLIDLSHRHDVSILELQLIDQKIEEIDKFLADTLGILEIRVGFIQKSEIEYSQQDFLLEGLLQENSAFEEVSFISLEGRETTKKIRGRKEAELFDVSLLPKFQTSLEGENFIGELSYTLDGPFITLAAPVRNRNNDIIQILSAQVNLSQVTGSVETARLGADGYLVLVDADSVLLAHGAKTQVQVGTDLSGSKRVKLAVGGELLDGFGPRDRYESFLGTGAVVGAAKNIPTIGWTLLVEWPIEDADAVIQSVRNQIALLTLFSILAVMFLAPVFANQLLRPIRQLERGAAEIAKGNFTKRVEIKTDDELEELGAAFNRMTKGLKRLEELREEFVFIAAHELKAPVTIIKGYASMLLEEGTKSMKKETRDYVEEIQQANQRLLQLVQDLLEVARSEAGRIVVRVGPLDIRRSITATVDGLNQVAAAKSISLEYKPPSSVPVVLADDKRIKEIMENLISNAIKYTQKGGHVWISHEVQKNELITHVKDDGFGISANAQGKMFEKFYRVQTKQTQDVSGTGLGLFIVKQLVEKMKGRIWFESKEGKGTTFSFSLPIK